MFFNKKINKLEKIPEHVAIIMDGNGRWAKGKMLTRAAGHRAGAETLRKITDNCNELGIKHLTVYAFSTENWSRPKEEVDALMSLLKEYLQKVIDDNEGTDIKIDIIGDISLLDKELRGKIHFLEKKTESNTGINLHIALNYGGRDELLRAVKKVGTDIVNKKLDIEKLTEKEFEKYLDTKNTPDPDLLIRTSGEMRISNFLLWQISYTEFHVSNKLWPDFNKSDLVEAIAEYGKRKRRFGGRM